ncbi:MAG: hypothetical protein DSM106950_23930 [Stigonema ocellatum SAG 48.90 = DSM 106950]|nr:hypothetical protein [Stigonema ocellatum SAG 48.90 = DSM 106950]
MCSKCNEVTVKKVSETLKEPTESEEGEGVDIYRCCHCSHEYRNYYSIPRKTSTSDDGGYGDDSGHGDGF